MNLNTPKQSSASPMPSGNDRLSTSTSSGTPPRSWAAVERVVLDLGLPHIAIARALDRSDDEAIWREYRCTHDEDGFLECLAALAGNYWTEQPHFRDPARSTGWRHALVVVPFLMPTHSWPVAVPSGDDRASAAAVVDELQQWAGAHQPARVVLGCVRYSDLCRWSPVSQREYLQLLARERPSLLMPLEAIPVELPGSLPQLAFAIASVRCWNATPQLPDPSEIGQHQWELLSRLAACLSYSQQCAVAPDHVLLPARLKDGVLAGLLMWIGALARNKLVRTWDLQPWGKDVWLLQLASGEKNARPAVIPLRLHQLGAGGLPALMAALAEQVGSPMRITETRLP